MIKTKARGVLTNIQNYAHPGGPPTEAMAQVLKQEHDALQIGIEAIDFIHRFRGLIRYIPEFLPSETKE